MTYELENMHYVDGAPEKCEPALATFFSIYLRNPPDENDFCRAVWVADIATRDDAEFILKCLEAQLKYQNY